MSLPFDTLFRANPVAMSVSTLTEGRFIDVNTQFLALFGYSREELLHHSAITLGMWVNPAHRVQIVRDLQERGISEMETTVATRSGTHREVFASLEIIEVEQTLCVLASLYDITERKQMERALQESEARFRRLTEASFEGLAVTEGGVVMDVNQAMAAMFGYEPSEMVGQPSLTFVAPDSQEEVQRYLTLGYEGTYQGWGLRKDGSTFPIEVHGRAILLDGRPARVVAVRDLGPLHLSEAALRHSHRALERRVAELTTLHQVAQEIARLTDLPATLQQVAQQVCALLDASHVCIRWGAAVGAEPFPQRVAVSAPGERGTTHTGALPPHFFASVTEQTACWCGSVTDLIYPLSPTQALVVPLVNQGIALGLFYALREQNRPFTQAEQVLGESIAGFIVSAIAGQRFLREAQALAVESERQRVARDLHDSVTQLLYSITLMTSGWQAMAASGTLTDIPAAFERLHQISQRALAETRLLIYQLRPTVLRERGLVGALQQRLETVEQRSGIQLVFQVSGQIDVPASLEEHLFAIAQEALNNALHHAEATTISLGLQGGNREILLSVRDDGKGFDPNLTYGGIGLDNIRERVRLIGGTLSLTSAPNAGTAIRVQVPLDPEGDELA